MSGKQSVEYIVYKNNISKRKRKYWKKKLQYQFQIILATTQLRNMGHLL